MFCLVRKELHDVSPSFSKARMPTRPNRQARATSAGQSFGAKHALPAEKMEWILKFNDVMMALLLKSDKGVRPSDRDDNRRLKHEYKKKTPSWTTLLGWRTQAKRLKEGVEDALAAMARSGRPSEFTEAHQQQIDDALTDNKYLPDSQLAADLGVCLPTAMKYKEMAGWCTAHTRRVTLLNPTHKVERNSFSENHRGKELRHRAAGDEKLFQNIPPAKMSVKMEDKEHADSLESGSEEEEEEEDLSTPKRDGIYNLDALDIVSEVKLGWGFGVTTEAGGPNSGKRRPLLDLRFRRQDGKMGSI